MTGKENEHHMERRQNSRNDRWVKLGFLAVALVVASIVYVLQRRDPAMPGWTSDLSATLQAASQDGKNIVVAITNKPMGFDDKQLVSKALTYPRSVEAMTSLGVHRVQLNDSDHRDVMERYGVQKLPTSLLLGPDGKEIRRHEGVMNDIAFCNDFLGITDSESLIDE